MPMCPLVDCHTHTSFSDGHASFEDNVRAAAAAGCRVMSRPTISPCPPAWMLTARCRLLRVTSRRIVWLLRTLAILPLRSRQNSPLSTVSNAIGTRAASLWLSAGPRAPSCAWAVCTGLATQAISWPVPRVRRERRTSLVPIRPIRAAAGSTMTPTCTFGKTWGYAACGSAMSMTGAAPAQPRSTLM